MWLYCWGLGHLHWGFSCLVLHYAPIISVTPPTQAIVSSTSVQSNDELEAHNRISSLSKLFKKNLLVKSLEKTLNSILDKLAKIVTLQWLHQIFNREPKFWIKLLIVSLLHFMMLLWFKHSLSMMLAYLTPSLQM